MSDPVTFTGFPAGANNRARETDLPEGALRSAVNVDITREGNLLRREGYALQAGGLCHSLWSAPALGFALVAKDGELCRIDPDLTITPLGEIHPLAPVSYAELNGEVYYSNGIETGRITAAGEAAEWGVETPAEPIIELIPGGMPPGGYLLALTFIDARGEEGGASAARLIPVEAGQTIRLIHIPQPPPGGRVRVYLSPPNGELLYHSRDIPAGMASAVLYAGQGKPLETHSLRRPPPGQIVRAYHGRLYIGLDNALLFTEALRPGLYRPSEGFYLFPGRVTVVEPVGDGLYVCAAGKTYFLHGPDALQFQQRLAAPYGAIEGTGARIAAPLLAGELGEAPKALWWSDDGVLTAGLPEGRTVRLSADRLGLPRYGRGALFYREGRGVSQLLSVLHDSGGVNRMAASDAVVAEVVRNGIVVA